MVMWRGAPFCDSPTRTSKAKGENKGIAHQDSSKARAVAMIQVRLDQGNRIHFTGAKKRAVSLPGERIVLTDCDVRGNRIGPDPDLDTLPESYRFNGARPNVSGVL